VTAPTDQLWKLRLARVAVAIFLVWFTLGPWPRSWVADGRFDSSAHSYNEATCQRHDESPPPITDGPIRAGAARIGLAQTLSVRVSSSDLEDLPLAGYGKRVFMQGNAGVDDEPQVKVLALDNGTTRILLVTVDLLYLNRVIVAYVLDQFDRESIDVPRENILFSASHTHSAWGGYAGKLIECASTGRPRPGVVEAIARAITLTSREAIHRLEPARVAFASGSLAPGAFTKNRIDPDLPCNDWLDVMTVQSTSTGCPLGTVVIFSAHATCRSSQDRRVSADYPGVLCRIVEGRSQAPCLFLAGSVGSMGPPEMGPPRARWATKLGTRLADEVYSLTPSAEVGQNTLTLAAVGFDWKTPAPQGKFGRDWRLSPVAAGIVGPALAYLQAVRIGPWILAATPADYSGELALELRKANPGLTTIITSFNGDYAGYILPDRHDDHDSYEPRSMNILGPTGGSQIDSAVRYITTLLQDN
jgi:hypothetical protein